MRRFILSIVAIISCSTIVAQDVNMPLRIVIPEENNIPAEASNNLQNRLSAIIAHSGIVDDYWQTSQFMLTAKTFVDSKDIIGTAPTMYSMNLNVTLYIADWITGNLYAQTTVNVKGAGDSETKAYINAFKQLNINNSNIASLIDDGCKKIIAYYNSEGDNIINKAKLLAENNQYEEALFWLTSIPSICTDCYKKAQPLIISTYKSYTDYRDYMNYAKAKAIWVAGQNRDAAKEAVAILSTIEYDASCRPEVEKLFSDINKRIGEEWDLTLKTYSDTITLEKERIAASRAIGTAYGNGQQANTTNIFNN